MFVVITNYAGAYIFPDGYINKAINNYEPQDFTNLTSHLTNEHLHDQETNVIQIQTQNLEFFSPFYEEIKTMVSKIVQSLKTMHPQAFNCQQ